MADPLDVSLRVRLRYEAGETARRAVGDLEAIATRAQRLGVASGGDKLARELRAVSAQAQATGRDLSQIAQSAVRFGGGDGATRLATGLKDAGRAAGAATRDLSLLGQAAARFGAVSTVAYLTRDLKAVHAPAETAKRDLNEVRDAANRLGRSTGLRTLEEDLQRATRRADDLERRLGAVGRRAGGGGGSRGGGGGRGGGEGFADEAFRAAGLGATGVRLGMGAAAAGGLAAGTGIAAIGGSMAVATRQAISFEHAMTEVGKAIGSTPDGMRDLESQFLALSRKTGIRPTEIAGIGAQAGYFNVPREQIPGFAELSAKAAVGFQMRPDEATEAFGPLIKSYKLKNNNELTLAGDAINTVGDSVGVRERHILTYLNRTSGVAGMGKIPIAQNAAIGGAVQSLGVAPEIAATGVGQVFAKLSTADTNRDKDFNRGLRRIHMSGRQVKSMMDQDAVGGLLTVLEKIQGLDHGKRANFIKEVFGEGEIATVSRMSESVDVLREALEKVNDPAKYQGSLERTFKIFSSDTTASINRAGTALESFAVRIGERFNPIMKASADIIARWAGDAAKAMELADRAKQLSDKQLGGEEPSEKEKQELAADPRLKAETDRRVTIGREEAERRGVVEEEGRDRARARAPRGAPGEPPPPGPAAPRQPDEEDAAAAKAREQARLKLDGQIRDLDAELEVRKRGGFETTADRLRLRKLQEQRNRQFPETGEKSDALPGTGKRSDLEGGVKASLAAYHDDVERGLERTERLVREASRRMRDDLAIRPKVQDAAYRVEGSEGVRIERASLGGGSAVSPGGLGAGGRFGGGAAGGGWRHLPGRFGGAVPEMRGGTARFGGRSSEPRGGAARFGAGRAGGGGSRRGGSSEPAEDGPTANIRGALNPRLAGSRKSLMDELDRDPALRKDVLKTASMENRGTPFKMQTVLESMVNRSKMNGYGSLRQAIHSGFYGPVNRGGLSGALSEKDRLDGEAALKNVREGSNAIGFRTDQGMLTDPGARRYMQEPDKSGHRVIGGENYFYMGQKGREWARRQEAADAQGVQPGAHPSGSFALKQIQPWTRREMEPRSPRFMDPASYQLKPGAGGDQSSGAPGAARFGVGGPSVVQHFHTGADAQEVGRRAQLEQNREVRRTMAGSLHDGFRPA